MEKSEIWARWCGLRIPRAGSVREWRPTCRSPAGSGARGGCSGVGRGGGDSQVPGAGNAFAKYLRLRTRRLPGSGATGGANAARPNQRGAEELTATPATDYTPELPPRYSPSQVMDLRLDDVVRLRKPHPCGSYDWRIYRLGADIGIRCLGCDHRVLIHAPP